MRDREEIVRNLLCILREGLLRIRASSANASQCFIEADHLHNLPMLIAELRPELLRACLEVECPAYRQNAADSAHFEPYWANLRSLLEREAKTRTSCR